MLLPAVVITSARGCERAPMPVTIVSYCELVRCSWYSSVIDRLGDAPSPGSPISGSNLLLLANTLMFEALHSTP